MGERQSDGGPAGRRRVRPAGTPPQPDAPHPDAPVTAGPRPEPPRVEALLAAALTGDATDTGAQQRAVAAFRTARDTGAHRARTRRRDDWRPRESRTGGPALKATLSVLVAGLTLGGVAWAGIGTAPPSPGRAPEHAPAASAPDTAPSADPAPALRQGAADRPSESSGQETHKPGSTSPVTEAHCRTYERLRARGHAPDAPARRHLAEAAGSVAEVAAYCAGLLGGPPASATPPGRQGGGPPEAADGANGRGTATGRPGAPGEEAARGWGTPGDDAPGRSGAARRDGGRP
ncbi:hypothetical protein ACIRPP_04175 [Streptomyces sp. NPDC101219]|uniref:hypothetical protein n=1 Tax=Streptomyces sp. NPDC101219 TaxID=3366131 RepID=UPI00382FDB3D